MNNNLKHPAHYNFQSSGVECRKIIRRMNFNLGSAFKYIWRCDHKGKKIQDLEKAVGCIEDEIKMERIKFRFANAK